MSPTPAESPTQSPAATFLAGLLASFRSVFALVLIGTYVGVGALGHDYGFSLAWIMLSTVLVWAGPAQVIMISALGTGAPLFEVALAVFLSAVRFLPMVVALLPLLRGPRTRVRDLLLPAHFTAASMWVESFRLLPPLPQDARIPFCNGLAIGGARALSRRQGGELAPRKILEQPPGDQQERLASLVGGDHRALQLELA